MLENKKVLLAKMPPKSPNTGEPVSSDFINIKRVRPITGKIRPAANLEQIEEDVDAEYVRTASDDGEADKNYMRHFDASSKERSLNSRKRFSNRTRPLSSKPNTVFYNT